MLYRTPLLAVSASLFVSCALREPPLPPAIPAPREHTLAMFGDAQPLSLPPPSAPPLTPVQRLHLDGFVRLPSSRSTATLLPKAVTTSPETTRGPVLKFAWEDGRIYPITVSTDEPVFLSLPTGERLAAAPAMNPEQWVVGLADQQERGARRETVILRAITPGLSVRMGLLLRSGGLAFAHVTSQSRPAVIGASWFHPAPLLPTVPAPVPLAERPPQFQEGRDWCAYTITHTPPHRPAWTPGLVCDDGQHTFVWFPEVLTFTRAPFAQGIKPNRKPALVQSMSYRVPDHPERGELWVVRGLWPQLLLRGDEMRVRLTRAVPPGQGGRS